MVFKIVQLLGFYSTLKQTDFCKKSEKKPTGVVIIGHHVKNIEGNLFLLVMSTALA